MFPIEITIKDLGDRYLTQYTKIHKNRIHSVPSIGRINGLWANHLGRGGIIPIETVFFPTSTFLDLKLTGLQGDVMKESMNVAKSLAWKLTSQKQQKELVNTFDETRVQGIHIHCPEGAVSKDGPSAGAAITLAIFSLLNNIHINHSIAITGEVNLQGEIMAIGGLEYKIIGAIHAGVKTILFPEANAADFDAFMKKTQDIDISEIHFIKVDTIQEVFAIVFPNT
jgi:ATP-dependent Lon protease